MIAIVDYGAGNLFSVGNALAYLNLEYKITGNPEELEAADAIILPGVGAFADAMTMLTQRGLVEPIRQLAGRKPLLGICLGMQILFEVGYEFGTTKGLGLIPGCVKRIDAPGLKLPHMGWNDLKIQNPDPLTQGLQGGEYVYFVHSYRADCPAEQVAATTWYGEEIPAMVHNGLVFGAQFHPEKSGAAGLKILQNFGRLAER